MSYVYLAPLTNQNVFKIGKANNPQKRISHLSMFYAFDYEKILLIYCKDEDSSFILENNLHQLFNEHNVRLENTEGTEFFSMSIYEKVIAIVKLIAEINLMEIHYFDIHSLEKFKALNLDKGDVAKLTNSLFIKIKSKRIELGLSQKEMAKECDIPSITLRRMESKGLGSITNLMKVIKFLNLEKVITDIDIGPLNNRKRSSNLKKLIVNKIEK